MEQTEIRNLVEEWLTEEVFEREENGDTPQERFEYFCLSLSHPNDDGELWHGVLQYNWDPRGGQDYEDMLRYALLGFSRVPEILATVKLYSDCGNEIDFRGYLFDEKNELYSIEGVIFNPEKKPEKLVSCNYVSNAWVKKGDKE